MDYSLDQHCSGKKISYFGFLISECHADLFFGHSLPNSYCLIMILCMVGPFAEFIADLKKGEKSATFYQTFIPVLCRIGSDLERKLRA